MIAAILAILGTPGIPGILGTRVGGPSAVRGIAAAGRSAGRNATSHVVVAVTAKAKDGLGGGGVGGLDVGVHILRVRVVKKDAYALLSHLIWF